MTFKSQGNSRGGRSGRSVSRTSNTTGASKRSSSGNEKSVNSGQTGSRTSKKYTGGPSQNSPFSPKGKPYSGRPADTAAEQQDQRPKRNSGSYKAREEEGPSERISSTSKARPYTGRPTSVNAPQGRVRPSKKFGGEKTEDKKPYVSRSRSAGSFPGNDTPKRSSNAGESFGGTSPGRPSFKSGVKRAAGDGPYRAERPQRAKSVDENITGADAPVKTMRGRKKPVEKESGLIRLNRYIANAGICSRRKADELIAAGVVSVNGIVVSELGQKVDPQKDEIRYNGETLKREKMVYVLLNKPKDYITTTEDPQERRTVMHLVEKASRERIYPIGRLDRNTTGLLLMTNDGDLADKLSHPKNNIVKLYQAELNKSLTQGDLNKIGFGIELEDGLIKPDSISYVAGGTKREIGIQIHSGKNRIVRRIFEHLGYEVVKLDRAVYANLTKKDLPRGRWRYLDEKEVIQLKHLI